MDFIPSLMLSTFLMHPLIIDSVSVNIHNFNHIWILISTSIKLSKKMKTSPSLFNLSSISSLTKSLSFSVMIFNPFSSSAKPPVITKKEVKKISTNSPSISSYDSSLLLKINTIPYLFPINTKNASSLTSSIYHNPPSTAKPTLLTIYAYLVKTNLIPTLVVFKTEFFRKLLSPPTSLLMMISNPLSLTSVKLNPLILPPSFNSNLSFKKFEHLIILKITLSLMSSALILILISLSFSLLPKDVVLIVNIIVTILLLCYMLTTKKSNLPKKLKIFSRRSIKKAPIYSSNVLMKNVALISTINSIILSYPSNMLLPINLKSSSRVTLPNNLLLLLLVIRLNREIFKILFIKLVKISISNLVLLLNNAKILALMVFAWLANSLLYLIANNSTNSFLRMVFVKIIIMIILIPLILMFLMLSNCSNKNILGMN